MKNSIVIFLILCLCFSIYGCETIEKNVSSIVADVKSNLSETIESDSKNTSEDLEKNISEDLEKNTSASSKSKPSKKQDSTSNKNTESGNDEEKPLEKVVAKYGNSAGNLHNGGHATKQGEWIFYSTRTGIYKTNGQKTKKLSDVIARGMNICGDWLYYLSDQKCYRIKTNGQNQEVFLNDVSSLYIADGWVYYQTYKYDGLYRIKTDKTQNKHIIKEDKISNLNIIDNKIYWGNNVDLYVANCDGSNIKHYVDAGSQELIIDKGLKYTSGNLDVENIDGTNTKVLVQSGAMNIVLQDDWIYFIYYEDGSKIYKIKTNGTGLTKLTDHSVISLCVVGDWIYYSPMIQYEMDGHTQGWENGYRRMRIDGSKNVKLK
ncbi:MAG: DUF5050 domain-containing protein [Clostridia bacterium]|nr:DUF5050 domain-containing protein [Clostridia bacterium]